jgi:hypothetical protein
MSIFAKISKHLKDIVYLISLLKTSVMKTIAHLFFLYNNNFKTKVNVDQLRYYISLNLFVCLSGKNKFKKIEL